MAQALPPGSERLGLGAAPRSPREPGREGPDRGQAAGPEPRVTVTLCCWPLALSQVILTLSPGWWVTSAERMSLGELMDWPATEVISSPAARPAWLAAPPGTVPAIAAPLPPADCCWLAMATPRKAVGPTCTVADPVP